MRKAAPAWVWWAGGGALLVLLASGESGAFGGPNRGEISRDPKLLLPAFAARLAVLFRRMRARGFDPMLFEGWRSPARAAALAAKGTGKLISTHTAGAGADIVSASKLWSDPAFFVALGQEAEAIGLSWGGRFHDADLNHVQAVSPKNEATLVAKAPAARNAYVASLLG